MYRLFFTLFLIFVTPNIAQAQLETRPTPLWEGVEKSADDVKNDKNFVKQTLELTKGDSEKAVRIVVGSAWELIGKGDPNGAIRRFNQASLIQSDFPDIFWGLAIATHIRGDELEKVERWMTKAKEGKGRNARLSTDHGRILGERGMPKKARTRFEEALAFDPQYSPAHIGMIRIAQDLEDKALEDKHQKLYDDLVK